MPVAALTPTAAVEPVAGTVAAPSVGDVPVMPVGPALAPGKTVVVETSSLLGTVLVAAEPPIVLAAVGPPCATAPVKLGAGVAA